MENIIGSLDQEALTKNKDLIHKALRISEIEEDEKGIRLQFYDESLIF